MMIFTKRQKNLIGKTIRDEMEKLFPEKGRGRRLALLLGVSPSTVSQWASGKKTPSLLRLYQLSKLFNIPLHQLCRLPKQKNVRTKNLAAAIIRRMTSVDSGKPTLPLEKTPNAEMKHSIHLINKELDDLIKYSNNDE